MKLADVAELPTTLDAAQTAGLLGCSVWSLYEQVKAGTAPVMPLKLGRCYRWPTATVLRAIGIEPVGGANQGRDDR